VERGVEGLVVDCREATTKNTNNKDSSPKEVSVVPSIHGFDVRFEYFRKCQVRELHPLRPRVSSIPSSSSSVHTNDLGIVLSLVSAGSSTL
jgi:hypothetical protein